MNWMMCGSLHLSRTLFLESLKRLATTWDTPFFHFITNQDLWGEKSQTRQTHLEAICCSGFMRRERDPAYATGQRLTVSVSRTNETSHATERLWNSQAQHCLTKIPLNQTYSTCIQSVQIWLFSPKVMLWLCVTFCKKKKKNATFLCFSDIVSCAIIGYHEDERKHK